MAQTVKAALTLALLAAPAVAQDAASWGATTPKERSAVALLPGTEGAVLDVLCINHLTGGHSMAQQFDLTRDGITVSAFVFAAPGDNPDTYTIAVPEGYRADPPEVTIEEGESAVVRVFIEWGT